MVIKLIIRIRKVVKERGMLFFFLCVILFYKGCENVSCGSWIFILWFGLE